jgi:hypothetical protein
MALTVFFAVFLFTFLKQTFSDKDTVEAANLANFDPGYIISDYQMGNYNSLTEVEIQAFLTAKNPCGNTNQANYELLKERYPSISWHFENGHFICLSQELFGDGEVIGEGETAAHIIWQAAQDYQINPQVIIVLLQKEQGLITDDFPNSRQYRSATGYGCPDTAACSTKYYGFKNQVRNAAAMFRTVLNGGWTNYPLGNNYIQYNPNADCGGSIVNVRNLATSALYRYTPYQPNEGALAAGYGTAYCGSYGNRNFYHYFEDWFSGIIMEDPTPKESEEEGEIEAPTNLKAELLNGAIQISWEPVDGGARVVNFEVVVADVDKNEYKKVVESNEKSAVFYGLPMNEYFAASVKTVGVKESKHSRIVFSIKNYGEFSEPEELYEDFTDMPTDEISKKAVSWAVHNGITDKNTSFNGEQALSRRQAMVLLWRLAGQPEVELYEDFTDMPTDEISKKAVSWAVHNGITDKNTSFNGEQALSRRQAMVLLWRIYSGFINSL